MNITITGATGFIGRRLVARLGGSPHQIHALSRHTNIKFGDTAVWVSKWDPMTEEPPEESLVNADAIVHLAGEPVAQRWTSEAKTKILESRVQGTRRLVQALSTQKHRPAALVCRRPSASMDREATKSSRSPLHSPAISWRKSARNGRSKPGWPNRWASGWPAFEPASSSAKVEARWKRCCLHSRPSSAARSDRASSGCPGFTSTTW